METNKPTEEMPTNVSTEKDLDGLDPNYLSHLCRGFHMDHAVFVLFRKNLVFQIFQAIMLDMEVTVNLRMLT